MELNTGVEGFDMGFKNPTPGISIMKIIEGIKMVENEDNDSMSLSIPMQIIKVHEGDADNLDMKCGLFVNLVSKEGKENTFGEKTICSLLSLTGLAEKFEKKFPGDTSFTDETFIGALMLKLIDQVIEVKHDIRTNDGKEYFDAQRLMKVTKKSGNVEEKAGSDDTKKDDAAAGPDGDDW